MSNDAFDKLAFQKTMETTAQVVRFGVTTRIRPELIDGTDVIAIADELSRTLVVTLEKRLLQREVRREVVQTFKYPATWWDAFKLRFFPEWALKRWPVSMLTLDQVVHGYHMCPHIKIPDKNDHLRFLTADLLDKRTNPEYPYYQRYEDHSVHPKCL